MPEFNPRAVDTGRGQHPDLVRGASGELELRADVDLPDAERAFRRMWLNPDERAAFMYRLAQRQRELPRHIQEYVGGRMFDGYGVQPDPYDGYREYLQTIQDYRSPTDFTGADIERMSLEEYDQHFDERGRPRQGVRYEASGRDVDVVNRRGDIDPFSAAELRNR